jgi:hypothetical protein
LSWRRPYLDEGLVLMRKVTTASIGGPFVIHLT